MNKLAGVRVALLESRRSEELSSLVRRRGGEPYCVPAVREVPRACAQEVAALLDAFTQGAIHMVVFLTGVGVQALFHEAEQQGRLEELRRALQASLTACRGPKPSAVLKGYGVPIRIAARTPFTSKELLEAMASFEIEGKGVALIHYGERNQALTDALRERGAHLEELCLYEWALPEDRAPLQQLVQELVEGQFQAIAFTSQVQIRHLFLIAAQTRAEASLRDALNTHVVVGSVGPTCSAALERVGVVPRVIADPPKMGQLIEALGRFFEARSLSSA